MYISEEMLHRSACKDHRLHNDFCLTAELYQRVNVHQQSVTDNEMAADKTFIQQQW